LLLDHVLGVGIDLHAPHHREGIALVALEDAYAHRAIEFRETHRLAETTAEPVRLLRRAPLAEDGREATRVQQVAGFRIHHLDPVLAAVGLVEVLRHVARPGQGLDQHALDGVAVGQGVAAVGVVEADGGGLLGKGGARGERQGGGKKAEHAVFLLRWERHAL